MAIVAQTPEQINRFQAVVIKNALKLYRDTGMKANRAYTPANMRMMAEKLTGKKFKARDYTSMIDALQSMLEG